MELPFTDWPRLFNVRPFVGVIVLFTARYALMAGGAYWLFYRRWRERHAHKKIQMRWPKPADLRREVRYSLLSSLIFAGITGVVMSPALAPYVRVYRDIGAYSWAYFAFSVVLMFVLHDLYFYVTHRLMHHPWVFRRMHKLHHLSRNPTPLAAFSFHPLEAVVEYGIFAIFVFFVPMHPLATMIWLLGMTVINIYGHLGWELYPDETPRRRHLRWLNTAVSHNQHHAEFRYNFGLYTLIWDRLFGTLSPDYEARFDEVASRRQTA